MLVTLNMASVKASHHAIMGLPFSPTIPRPMAKNRLKTTICSTSFLAMASMAEVGTMCRKIWSQVCAAVVMGGGPEGAGSTMPTPGCMMLTASRPISSARVVTTSK